jgi:hypothetical protein
VHRLPDSVVAHFPASDEKDISKLGFTGRFYNFIKKSLLGTFKNQGVDVRAEKGKCVQRRLRVESAGEGFFVVVVDPQMSKKLQIWRHLSTYFSYFAAI